jgi:hypothetical protein
MKLTKEIIAHHEADHLVAAPYQGLKVPSTTIVHNGDVARSVEGERNSRAFRAAVESSVSTNMEPRHKDRFEKEARSLLAGLVARRRFAPGSVREGQNQHRSPWRYAGGRGSASPRGEVRSRIQSVSRPTHGSDRRSDRPAVGVRGGVRSSAMRAGNFEARGH